RPERRHTRGSTISWRSARRRGQRTRSLSTSSRCAEATIVGPVLLALGGLSAMAAAVGIGRFVYTPILPLMVEDLRMTKSAAGLLASATFAGYLAGALAAALPALPGSRRRWLIAALIVSALTTAGMAIPSSIAAFLVLRFVGGGASAFGLVFSSPPVLQPLSAVGWPRSPSPGWAPAWPSTPCSPPSSRREAGARSGWPPGSCPCSQWPWSPPPSPIARALAPPCRPLVALGRRSPA